MLIHELREDECRALLRRAHLARLACSRHDQAYIVPISVHYDEQYLYAFSTHGQKIDWMRANPKVCVEVEEVADNSHWTTVLVFGRYQELTDSPDDRQARDRARQLFEQRPGFWLPAAAKLSSAEHPIAVVYRICIDRLTGRRAARQA